MCKVTFASHMEEPRSSPASISTSPPWHPVLNCVQLLEGTRVTPTPCLYLLQPRPFRQGFSQWGLRTPPGVHSRTLLTVQKPESSVFLPSQSLGARARELGF